MPKPPFDSAAIDRRLLLKAAAGAALAGGARLAFGAGEEPAHAIASENARPGTREWLLAKTLLDTAPSLRSSAVEGYCSAMSAEAGERVLVLVSARPATRVSLELYRMGYYGGDGARRVKTFPSVPVAPQPVPEAAAERRRECAWPAAFEIVVEPSWTSGVYLGKLSTAAGAESYVVFVVRDRRAADVVVQCSTNTWAAYDRWPGDGSLYDDGHKAWSWGPHVEVSLDRPFAKYCQIVDAPLSLGSGEFLLWEYPLVYWLEQQGYDVTYTTNEDTHADPQSVRRAKLWISSGHDEYWTLEMHRNVVAARDAGTSLAFLSGNTCFGLIELLPNRAGRPHRTVRRVGQFGSVDARFAEDFPEARGLARGGPDEAALLGARSGYPVTASADWTCRHPEHWLFAGTGMRSGDAIPGLVGWEWHGEPAPIHGLEVLASGPIKSATKSGRIARGEYTATLYPGPRGNFVWNGATIWWNDGLAEPPGYVRPFFSKRFHLRGPDPRVQRMTANLIARAMADSAR